jgi:hypothetical protein
MKIGNIFLKIQTWLSVIRRLGIRWTIIIGLLAAIYWFFTF